MKESYLNDRFFSRLETLALHLRSDLVGFFGGKHLVKTYGQTVEFADYREYQLGDDIRRIDWNLYSRFEKYFLKLFTDERQMHVQIFLDCSASMGKDDPQKRKYAIALVAALGFLAVHNMDKLSIHLIKGDVSENPFGTLIGKKAFFNAIGSLEEMEFSGDADIGKAVQNCPAVGSNNGLTIIISDFFTDNDWKKAINYLMFKKRQVLVMQLITPEELEPSYSGRFDLLDCESEGLLDEKNIKMHITRNMQLAYDEALKDFMADIQDFCASRGAGCLTINTGESLERALFGKLLQVGVIE